ncbi:MAG: BACON domain-containing protein [Sumerlaeia bacterium]
MSCITLWKSMVSAVTALAAIGAVQSANAAILQIDTSTPVEFPNSVQVPVNVAAFTGFTPDASGILTITGTINYNTTELQYVQTGTIGQIDPRFDGAGNIDIVEGPPGTLTFTATTDPANPIVSGEGTVPVTILNFTTTPLQGGNPAPNMTFPSNITFNEAASPLTFDGAPETVVYDDNEPLDILTPQCLYNVDDFNPLAPTVAAPVANVNFPVEYLNVPATGITGYDFLVNTPLGCSFNLTIQSDINVALPLGSEPLVTITGIAGEAGLGGVGVPTGTVGGNGTNRVTFDLAPNNTGQQIIRAIRVTAPDTGRSRFIRLVQDACEIGVLTPDVNNATAAAVNDFGVTFETTCDWTASVLDPADDWVLNANGVGIFEATGDGTDLIDGILYDLAANLGPERSAVIRISSTSNPAIFSDHTIIQASGCEVLTLTPPTNEVAAIGATMQSFSFTLSDASCITETTIDGPMVPWITNISAPVEGPDGTFTITYDVDANVGPARGPVTFDVSAVQNGAPLTHTVTQLNGCSLTINPSEDLFSQAGEVQTFNITLSDVLCGFTIVEKDAMGNVVDVPWVTLDATAGVGNTTISVTAAPNAGSARSAILCVIDDNGVETEYTICQEGDSVLEAFFYGDTATDLAGEEVIGDPQGLNIFVDPNFNDGGIYIDSSEPQVTITGVPAWITLVEYNGGGDATGDITIASGPTLDPMSDPLNPTFTYLLDMNDNDGVIIYQVEPSSVIIAREATMTLVTGGGIPAACTTLLANEVIELSITQSADCLYGIEPVTASYPAIDDVLTLGTNELEGSFRVLSNNILINNNGCTWSATTSTPWITLTAPTSGVGTGIVEYVLAPNPAGDRVGTIELATENGLIVHTVTQAGACGYALDDDGTDSNPSTKTAAVEAVGGDFQVFVTAAETCGWTIAENSDWLEINFDPANGIVPSADGLGTFTITVDANQGPARFTTITLLERGSKSADKTNVLASIRVEQASGCLVLIDTFQAVFPANENISGALLTNSFPVTAGDGCTWTATETSPWVTLVNASGTGEGFVIYNVDPNLGPRRQTIITVGALTHTIVQESGCLVTVDGVSSVTTSATPAGSAAELYTIATTGDTCTWTATSNVPWITINNPVGGNGTGSIVALNNLSLNIAPNTTSARTGVVTITSDNNSVTITVNQEDGCSINAFTPDNQFFNQEGGSGIIPVIFAGDGANSCDWTATVTYTQGAPGWLVISEGGSGTGNGFVNYIVDSFYTGGTRVAEISVQTTSALAAGVNPRVFTITQTDQCLVSAIPAFKEFNQNGGFGQFLAEFNNTNSDGCPWTASVSYIDSASSTTAGNWVTINSSTAGNGTTQVNYTVSPYFDGGTRLALITVALPNGDTAVHTVSQTDNCAPVATPAELAEVLNHSTQSSGFQLTGMTQNCPWTAEVSYGIGGPAGWVSLTSGNNGSGNGLITYTVQPYLGDDFGTTRTATIRIIAQNGSIATHSFTQVSDCAFDAVEPFTPANATFDQRGGNRAFSINLAEGGTLDCDWTAASSVDWISIIGSSNGFGDGTIEYAVEPYVLGGSRDGSIVVTLSNGVVEIFNITQNDGCDVTISSSSTESIQTAEYDQNGGTDTAYLTFVENGETVCTWTAASLAPWIVLTGDTNGAGDSTLAYEVKPFYGTPARVGEIVVRLPNGDDTLTTLTITQTDVSDVEADASSAILDQRGAAGAFTAQFTDNVTMANTPWTATVTQGADWLTITSDTAGNGTTQINYLAETLYTGGTRVGIITVSLANGDTATHTVTQTDNCDVNAVPASANFTQDGGSGSFLADFANNTTMLDCPWNAEVTSGAIWVTITGSTSGTGDSTIEYVVAPFFLGGTRTAVITVTLPNGDVTTHTINQTDNCIPAAVPSALGYNQNGGTGNFEVQLTNGGVQTCPWSVSTSSNWVTITGDGNGEGNGSVQYSVAPFFLGGTRTATITVTLDNGLTAIHTVTQTDECDVTAVPATAMYDQGGASGEFLAQFAQANQLDCPWNASVTSGASWITITGSTEGTGTSTISYNVAPFFTGNGNPPVRTGVITVTLTNGDVTTHTITQTDNCDHELSPTLVIVDNTGGFETFNVNFLTANNNNTPFQCPWIARVRYAEGDEDRDWVQIVEGSTEGSGNGLVTFNVDPFVDFKGTRTAFIDVILDNGMIETFTIIQQDLCEFVVYTNPETTRPPSFTFDHNGVLTGPVFDEDENNSGTANFIIDFLNDEVNCEFTVTVFSADSDANWINIQEITRNNGDAQVFFEVDPNVVPGPDGERIGSIIIEGDNGQPAIIVTVVQSESYYTLSQFELADPLLQTPAGSEQDGSFGLGANSIVIGYTDLSDYSIEQDNYPTSSFFTFVDPKTNQTIRATLNVNADQRGYISGFVTLVALEMGSFTTSGNGFITPTQLGEITFPVSGRISYRRASKTTIQTADGNYSGLSDISYSNAFTIRGQSSNKAGIFVASGREVRKELRVFEPGQPVGFDVNAAALFRTGDINALGREPRARLVGWNPTSVNLAVIKNSFQATNRTNTTFSVDMLLLNSDYSPLGQQGVGAAGFRQRPAIGSRNGAYAFSGRLSTSPVIGFNSSGLHNLPAEVFQEEGFPLDGLDRGVNIFPQRTTFSNGQVIINGSNIWTKNLTEITPSSSSSSSQ